MCVLLNTQKTRQVFLLKRGRGGSRLHLIPAKTGGPLETTAIFTLGKRQGHLQETVQSDKKSNLGVMAERTRDESSAIGFGSAILSVLSLQVLSLMSLQLRAVDSTLDWRGLSCLLVTLATIAGHRRACTLWWCRRTMVRTEYSEFLKQFHQKIAK